MDITLLRNSLEQKPNVAEVDAVRQMIERVLKEVEHKASFRDLEAHVNYTKGCLEDIHKDLLLRANIKDVITLMDTKANVEDVNQTLSVV